MPDCTPHRIGWAVKQAKAGAKVTRRGWKVAGQFLTYVPATSRSKDFLAWNTGSGKTWPATLGQRDLLAEDWAVAR